MVERVTTDIQVDYICNQDPLRNDEILSSMPAGSVVINATGMGKDIPGSPITDAGIFPNNGVAWEFNYRGELDFLHQALAQRVSRHLLVEDGWVYFLHGWTQVVAQVLHVELDKERFEELRQAAESLGIYSSNRELKG
jgi:shikimate 5-dehydrogenase